MCRSLDRTAATLLEFILMPQTDLIHVLVGVLGFGLIVSSVLIIKSAKCYSLLSKTYFIEPISEEGKERVKSKIQAEEAGGQRYAIGILCLGLGVVAMLWSLGVIESVSLPFAILAAIGFIWPLVINKK